MDLDMGENTIQQKRTRNPFAMFAPLPVGVSFDEQDEGENIVLLLRAHIVTLVPALLEFIVLLVLPLVAILVARAIGFNLASLLAASQIGILLLCWYVFLVGLVFYRFIFWYFNVYLLTNERVIDFDFRGILHKETSYANLSQIQDVSPRIIGFFGTFFHFGNVFIQTAGEKPEFEFINVARPDDVARAILGEVRDEESEAPGEIA